MLVTCDGGAGHVVWAAAPAGPRPPAGPASCSGSARAGSRITVTRAESPSVETAAGPTVVGSITCVHSGDRHQVGVHGRSRGEELLGLRVDALPERLDARPGRVVLGEQVPTVEGLAGHGRLAELESVEQGLAADAECGDEVGAHRQQDADERHRPRVPGHRRTVAGEDPRGASAPRRSPRSAVRVILRRSHNHSVSAGHGALAPTRARAA